MNLSDYFYNDSALLGTYAVIFGTALIVLFGAIWFHELGHWLFFKIKLKKNVKIRFEFKNIYKMAFIVGVPEDYQGLTPKQYKSILGFGLLMGLLPILFAGYFWLWFLLIVIPYVIGSWEDIKAAYGDIKFTPDEE